MCVVTLAPCINKSPKKSKQTDKQANDIPNISLTDLCPIIIGASPAAAAAKSLQSCPTLCDPIDGSPPDSHSWDSPGKNMEWVAISFSSA